MLPHPKILGDQRHRKRNGKNAAENFERSMRTVRGFVNAASRGAKVGALAVRVNCSHPPGIMINMWMCLLPER